MPNRLKTERNQKIWDYWIKGYRQQSIANMFKIKIGAVNMVISRERARRMVQDDNTKPTGH